MVVMVIMDGDGDGDGCVEHDDGSRLTKLYVQLDSKHDGSVEKLVESSPPMPMQPKENMKMAYSTASKVSPTVGKNASSTQ